MLFEKPIAAALALTIGASLIGTAEAGHRYRHYGYHHHNNGAGIAAAGIFGLAAGALLGSALSQPRYYGYSQPAPPIRNLLRWRRTLDARVVLLLQPALPVL